MHHNKNIPITLIRNIVSIIIICVSFSGLVILINKIEPALIYHRTQPFFEGQMEWKKIIYEPGYLSSFFSLFLFQFFYSNIFGSIIFISLIFLWCLSLFFILKKYFDSVVLIVPVIISVIPVLVAHTNYNYPYNITVSYLIALMIGLLYEIIPKSNLYFNALIHAVLLIAVYLISGSAGLLVYIAIITGLFLLRIYHSKQSGLIIRKKDYLLYISQLITAFLTLIIFCLLLNTMPFKFALFCNLQSTYYEQIPAITYFQPVVLLFCMLLPVVISRFMKKNILIIESMIHAILFVFFLTGVFLIANKLEIKEKKLIRIDKYACEQEWGKLLEIVDEELIIDRNVQFQVNRALYHQDSLLEKMFEYPQYFGIDALYLERYVTGAIALYSSDLYYDLGLLNESRHWANESYTIFGDGPRLLERLADVFTAAQQYEIAEKFINKLDHSVVTRKRANELKQFLYCDSCVLKNANYKRFYESNPKEDFYASHKNPIVNLKKIYLNNPKNKMALEYLVADFLLSNKIKEAISLYSEFSKHGYIGLPRSCEEALLYYLAQNNIPMDKFIKNVDKRTVTDFVQLASILNKYNGDLIKAKDSLTPFKNTYWYYLFYNSPVTTKKEIMKKKIEKNL